MHDVAAAIGVPLVADVIVTMLSLDGRSLLTANVLLPRLLLY